MTFHSLPLLCLFLESVQSGLPWAGESIRISKRRSVTPVSDKNAVNGRQRVEPPPRRRSTANALATVTALLYHGWCRIERLATAVAVGITLPDDGEFFTMDVDAEGLF